MQERHEGPKVLTMGSFIYMSLSKGTDIITYLVVSGISAAGLEIGGAGGNRKIVCPGMNGLELL